MIEERQLLSQDEITITIKRLCQQLIESHNNFDNTIIVGVQPRGSLLSKRIINKLQPQLRDIKIESGNIDISFYRDDLRRRETPIVPEVMDMNVTVEGKDVVLVDDVLYTGRSVRSALDALMTFGRPKSVELLTLINRRFSRDLPIEPNYVGKTIDVLDTEKVIVEWKEINGNDRVLMVKLD